ncbi:DUF2029 domain-containing protein [Candidatus Microgenomates bacterium]|nr:DUF2029 domain-containing protein [Candidatus Microgenomates bacterium]
MKFTAWPEMLSYPYLVNHGFKLYSDFIHPYPPGLTLSLATIYSLFGYKLIILKLTTWVTILVSDLLIYLIIKKLTKKQIYPIIGVSIFVLTQPFLEGNMLWFDLAIVPFILFALLMLLNKKYFWSGLGFILAVLIKQTAGVFLIAAGLWTLFLDKDIKKVISFYSLPLMFGMITLIKLSIDHSLTEFFNWTLIYPFTYWSRFPGYIQMYLNTNQMVVIGLLFIPLLILLLTQFKKITKDRNTFFLVISLVISLIMVYPRFSFFHFQLALALVVILFSILAQNIKPKYLYICLTMYILLIIVISRSKITQDWNKETRFWTSEDIKKAQIIENQTNSNKPIFLFGLPSSYYIFSDRLPSKPWTDIYVWYLEISQVQKQIINNWNVNMPETIYWQNPQPGNWYDLATYQPQEITNWIMTNYNKSGQLEIGVDIWQKKN